MKKWARELNTAFPKEEGQIAKKKHMKTLICLNTTSKEGLGN
jgi:hypothetical protein